MIIELINQINNTTHERSLADCLIECLRMGKYTCMHLMVAFVNYGGIAGLSDEILKSSISDKKIIVGIDNKITSVEAIVELKRLGFDCKIYHSSTAPIFHPKFYLLENVEEFCLIIGSGNLTVGGLLYNDECNIMIKGNKAERIYTQSSFLFSDLWNSIGSNVKKAEEQLLDELYKTDLLRSEAETNGTYKIESNNIFGNLENRNAPDGFLLKSISKSLTRKNIRLLPHNQEIFESILNFVRDEQKKGYIVQPTGTGKSYLISKYIQHYINDKILLIAPNNVIIDGIKDVLGEYPSNILFHTFQYLSKDVIRAKKIAKGVQHILIDEFHHVGAVSWGRAVEQLILDAPNPYVIGFSATPYRDNDDIDVTSLFFDNNCIHSLSLFDCWDKKILPMPKLVQSFIELDNMLKDIENELISRYSGNEKTIKKIRIQVQAIKSKYISVASLKNIINEFIPFDTKRIVVFVPTIESIRGEISILENCFKELGFVPKCYQVHSKQSEKENNRQLHEFKKHEDGIKLIFSVDKLIEGIHIDDVDALLLLRGTNSVRIALQQLGRCLSSGKKKTPVVLDLVNNYKANNIFGLAGSSSSDSEETQSSDHIAMQINVLGNYAEIKQAIADLYSKFCTWEEKFLALVEYKNKHGETPKSKEVGKLYQWWISQRKEYRDGKMAEEHIRKFEENGFILDEWEMRFKMLIDFKNINNRFPVREDGSIGIWYQHQRQNFQENKLATVKIQKLQSIGAPLRIKQEWGEWFEKLRFFLKNNNREPLSSSLSKEDRALYSWLHSQRVSYTKGQLEEYKIKAFSQIGISLGISFGEQEKNDRFNLRIEELSNFISENGRLPKQNENRLLYNWINSKKRDMRKGKIDKKQRKILEELGIIIETSEEWQSRFQTLQAFVSEYSRLPCIEENKELINWYNKQSFAINKHRNGRSGLSDEQYKMLIDLQTTLST